MPDKLKNIDSHHQRFAELVAAGTRVIDAYRACGFRGTLSEARRMSREPRIAALIDQAQAQHRIILNATAESLLLELEEARQRAIQSKNVPAEVNAILGKAKVLGLLKDPKTQVNIDLIPKPAPMPTDRVELTVEEWRQQWSSKRAGNPSH